MQYAIFLATTGENSRGEASGTWHAFRQKIESIALNTEGATNQTCKLSENLWLLSLAANTHVLAKLVESAEQLGLEYKVLYCSESPLVFAGIRK